MSDQLDVQRDGRVLRVTFNRPKGAQRADLRDVQGLYDAW